MHSTQPAGHGPQSVSDGMDEPQSLHGEAELDISDAFRVSMGSSNSFRTALSRASERVADHPSYSGSEDLAASEMFRGKRAGEASHDEEMSVGSPVRVSLPDNAAIARAAAMPTPQTAGVDAEQGRGQSRLTRGSLFTSAYNAAAKTYGWAWKNRDRIIEAGLNGLSPTVQGVGTITGHLRTYGAGVALGALDGLNQTATEIIRAYQIYRQPEKTHPQPDYLRAGNGVVNMVGAAIYGASSAGAINQYAGGAGAAVQGVSLVVKQFLPKDAGTYYPSLPTHYDPRVHEVAALRTNSAPGEGQSDRSSGSQSHVSHIDRQRLQARTPLPGPSNAVSRRR